MNAGEIKPDWIKWLEEAMDYEKAYCGKNGRPSIFSPAIQYNLIAMALEKYVMAMVGCHGSLPENHTFTDLIRAWQTVAPLDEGLKKTILKFEDMQSICSMEKYTRQVPSREDINILATAVSALGSVAKEHCQAKRIQVELK